MAIIQKNSARLEFDSVALLQAESKPSFVDGQIVYIKGITASNDDGHGNFRYDSSSSATDDGATIINPIGIGNGRFLRVFGDVISVKDFGATGDGSTNDLAEINLAIAEAESLGGGTVFFPAGSYNIGTTGIVIDSQSVTLEGAGMGGQTDGKNGSRIIYTGTGAAIQLTFYPTNSWGSNIRNMHLDGRGTGYIGLKIGNDDTVSGNVSWWGTISNVYITGFEIGRLMIGTQNGFLEKVHCEANDIGTIYRRGSFTSGGLANTATVELSCRNYNNNYYGKIIEQAFSVKFLGCTDESNGYKNVVNGPLAWVLSTAYRLGEEVTNDSGKLYTCTTAGTSASSGGPTGTGTSITDGTVVWDYISAVGSISINYDGGWEEGAGDSYSVEQGYGSVKCRDYNFGSSDNLLDLVGGDILLDECFYSETGAKPTMRIGAGTDCQVTTLGESFAHFDVDADAKFSWGGRNRQTGDADPATAAPTIASNRGDMVTRQGDSGFANGYPFGWICTATGTPGTWYELGAMRILNKVTAKVPEDATGITLSQYDHTVTFDLTTGPGTPSFVRLPIITPALIGKDITLCLISTGTLTYSAGVGQTIEGGGSQTLTAQWENKTFRAYSEDGVGGGDWIQVD